MYRETGKIRLVQKALGHADLSTSMIYTHIVDEELEGALKPFRAGVEEVGIYTLKSAVARIIVECKLRG